MPFEDVLLEKAADLIIKYIDPLVERFRERIERRRENARISTREAFSAYYRTTISRYGKTKTLLYRAASVPLYDFYVDLDLRAVSGLVSTRNLDELFLHGNCLLITGGAGSGKSTLLKHLFLHLIYCAAGIPLFIELRQFSEFEGSFDDFVFQTARANNLELSEAAFAELLGNGRFVLLLDGLDEVVTPRASVLAQELERFVTHYEDIRAIVTSRPDYYRFVGWSRFHQLDVQPLSIERTLELLDKLSYDSAVKAAFESAVRERLHQTHASYLGNPLLTTLMLMTFEQYGAIEQRMHLFYSQVFETLYRKHDATKMGYRRTMQSLLDADDFRAAIAAFAIQTYLPYSSQFTEDRALRHASHIPKLVPLRTAIDTRAFIADLLTSVCFLVQEGLDYSYTHRSLQEYFAAVFALEYASSHRSSLLRRFRERLVTDSTLHLAFDMDRAAVEDSFLKAALEDLRLFVGWTRQSNAIDLLMKLLEKYGTIRLRRDSVAIELDDIARTHIDVVAFVEHAYRERKFTWHDSAYGEELRELLFERDVTAAMRKNLWSRERAITNLREADIVINRADLIDTEIREYVILLLAPAADSLEYACSILDVIYGARRAVDSSIEDLLLS